MFFRNKQSRDKTGILIRIIFRSYDNSFIRNMQDTQSLIHVGDQHSHKIHPFTTFLFLKTLRHSYFKLTVYFWFFTGFFYNHRMTTSTYPNHITIKRKYPIEVTPEFEAFIDFVVDEWEERKQDEDLKKEIEADTKLRWKIQRMRQKLALWNL